MANQILISQALPIYFYEMSPAVIPQYMSKHMDDYLFALRIAEYESAAPYTQKWAETDSVPLQFQSNFGSIQFQVIDCSGHVYHTVIANKVLANEFLTGFFAYQATISWAGYAPGIYWVKGILGGTTYIISEPQEVLDDAKDTLLLQYNDSGYHGDFLPTGQIFNFRCEAILDNWDFSDSRVFYKDQQFNPTTLSAIPYRAQDLILGPFYGVPDWVANKVNWILSFNNFKIDGRQWAVLDDSKMEAVIFDPRYKMRRYNIKLQEGYSRASKYIGVQVDANNRLLTSIVLDNTLFGPTQNAGDELIIITDVN